MEVNFLIGGEAGQGVQSMGFILAKTMAKAGYNVFANQDYESRVRGGHNFFQIRVSDSRVNAIASQVDLIIALNEETLRRHQASLKPQGIVIMDQISSQMRPEKMVITVPFEALAQKETGQTIMQNTVALGAALSLFHFNFDILASVLTETFKSKSSKVAELNVQAARSGYDYIQKKKDIDLDQIVIMPRAAISEMVLNGVEAVALGALAAGCKFMSGYPMTPSTGILQFFAGKAREFNVVFEQAEDEIAALNMIIGASFVGVRAMTATSGGGFALMVEALSLAGMTETPVVITLGQRAGPATGLPTRTEQGELEFAVYAGHGMFPRAVLAPGTIEDAFYLTARAFNIAERYQVPVIILTDTFLSDSYVTVPPFDLSGIRIDRGESLSDEDIHARGKYQYKRHELTESGISPRVFPGHPDALVGTDSDEHTEDGHITESAEIREQMVVKRLKKQELLRQEIRTPYTCGPEDADAAFVCWGSSFGAVKEALQEINDRGNKVRMIHLSEIWPFPQSAFVAALDGIKKFIVVESNVTGQLAHLIRSETGLQAERLILRFDGRPLAPSYILKKYYQEA
jgi:2-oxoglutarate ferredoxin oxidoreductase subunit alpha